MRLAPELMLKIFEYIEHDGKTSMLPVVLCCKKWYPLAQSVLYGDIVLDQERLIRFAEKSGIADDKILSLTLDLDIPLEYVYPSARGIEGDRIARLRLDALERLLPRINRMRSLGSFSMLIDLAEPHSPYNVLCSIIDEMPSSCAALELVLSYGSYTAIAHNAETAPATNGEEPGAAPDAAGRVVVSFPEGQRVHEDLQGPG